MGAPGGISLDTPANNEPNSVNPIRGTDAAPLANGTDAGGLADANGADTAPPSKDEGPATWSQWFAANAIVILFVAAGIGFIIWKQLDVTDLLKVAIGLGLVIFIHELGHFLAAKWCDVHVETFSIGFGKPIPGCRFKYGETTYKIGWIPLGGYVKMVGEGENADNEEAEEDPRSFKNKRVGQRMLIISAGVIMNILLACICFVVVYSHGVDENPPIIGSVESGSPAWREGIHSESIIIEIDGMKNPVFDDIRPKVMATSKGETVTFVYRDGPGGELKTIAIEPSKDKEALFPTVGVGPARQLILESDKRKGFRPYWPGSAAANAQPGFQSGDRIIACSFDPSDYTKVSPLPVDRREGAAGKLDYFEFMHRQQDMRGKKMIVRVERPDGDHDITVEPAYHSTTGMRMEMGRVAACRKNSPAASAKVLDPSGEEEGIQQGKVDAEEPTGDKIIQVDVVDASGRKIRWETGKIANVDADGTLIKPLDPLRLPYELEQWAELKPANRKVQVVVLRPTGRKEEKNESKRVALEMEWDETARYYREAVSGSNSPMSIPCLGLAYYVNAIVETVDENAPAAAAGIQIGDLVKQVRWKTKKPDGGIESEDWMEIKQHQWAIAFTLLQLAEVKELDLKIVREGSEVEVSLKATTDESWPIVDRGLRFKYDSRLHKADDVLDALGIGMHRTVRLVRVIYQNLYAMISPRGRVSLRSMSGPLSIADVSYKIAGVDLWQFILFIGMINVNLAVINFLPIPVLDGGHMVFLIYEKIRGKPAPETILAAAMYTGLALILALMCFVLFLDVKRLFF
jgi:regulator of sigma E protease